MSISVRTVVAAVVLLACASCAVVHAQNVFPWRPGAAPEQFWIATQRSPCERVSGQQGVWAAQPISASEETKTWSCGYVWTSAQSAVPELAPLRRVTAQLEPDPPVVSTNAGVDPELAAGWFEPLYARARARLEAPETRDPQAFGRVVRVAVLDTAADGRAGIIDSSGHGRAVSRVISELACGELQPCAAELSHVPALALDSHEAFAVRRASVGRGAFGTRAELAAAIERTVTRWEQDREKGAGPERLVINLSLGWSGCWESGSHEQLKLADLLGGKRSLGSTAVIRALARASCAGALVVAAGGNGVGDAVCAKEADFGGRPRHVFPGLWGGTPLEPEVCAKLFDRKPAIEETVPLLLGIGAVDDDDDQLSITDHEADLVAYGQAVVMHDATLGSGFTLQLSGTSISAAAVSGVAAAVLGSRPELRNTELVRLIRDAALPLRAAPAPGSVDARDFICNMGFAAEPCKEVRRVSLCQTLQHAQIGARCSAANPLPGFATMSPVAPLLGVVDCDSCGSTCPEECALSTVPEDTTVLPWVTPQPKPPACGTCAQVRTPLVFQAKFKYAVNNAVLRLTLPAGVQRSYVLTGVTAAGTAATSWQLPVSAAGATGAWLTYRASGTMAKESGDVPILDVPPFTPGSGGIVAP